MIHVHIERESPDRRICGFRVEGHAEYDEAGRDIVCAGVSAVTVGTVNAVEALTGMEPPARMVKGWLSAEFPRLRNKEAEDRMQVILESMIVMLKTMEQSYAEYIAVDDGNSS